VGIPVYGVTMGYWGTTLPDQAITDLTNLTSGHPERICLRYQAPMKELKDWNVYDIAVRKCNDAGIPIFLPIKKFPEGRGSAAEYTNFAVAMATRYNGKSGHGKADATCIGNEDFGPDDFGPLADTMIQCYQKIKDANPDMLILPCSILQRNEQKIRACARTLLQKASKFIDGINVHTYFGIPNGANISHVPDDGSVPNVPSFPQYIAAVRDECMKAGHPDMGIYDTEWGFASTRQNHEKVRIFTESDQMKWLLYCLTQGMQLGLRHMSWFTLAYHSPADGMSLRLGAHLTPAFQAYKGFIAQHPTWDDVPVPEPTPEPTPPPEPLPIGDAIQQAMQAIQRAQLAQREALALLGTLIPSEIPPAQ
jgi:hypothetical protein